MKTLLNLLCGILLISLTFQLQAQTVMIFQYRQVAPENISEFVKRETTYWSKVAEKGIEDGKLQSWAILQKVGGHDIPNSPNFLFVNVMKNVDEAAAIWDPSKVFPDVPVEHIETGSLSTTTSMFFFRPGIYMEAPGVSKEDIRFVKINYSNSSAHRQLVSLEIDHWGPFIEAEMAKEGTSQVAWGNAGLIYPYGPDIMFNTVSFDFYPTIQETLVPQWAEGVEIPEEGMAKINEITLNRRGVDIYQIVMSVDGDEDN